MEKFLQDIIYNISGISIGENNKNLSFISLSISVEKTLYIIVEFAKHYNINIKRFYDNIKICSFSELIKIAEGAYGKSGDNR